MGGLNTRNLGAGLRCEEGERDAVEEQIGAIVDGLTPREVVYLGFVVPVEPGVTQHSPNVVWVPLQNAAPFGSTDFVIEDATVREALAYVRSAYGAESVVQALWHCHYTSAEPSAVDIAHFPAWAGVGVVWCVDGTTTLYDNSGVLAGLSASPSSDSAGA